MLYLPNGSRQFGERLEIKDVLEGCATFNEMLRDNDRDLSSLSSAAQIES
jgi:hypothetical protein